jgi:rhodanese-related sulfurtransferase
MRQLVTLAAIGALSTLGTLPMASARAGETEKFQLIHVDQLVADLKDGHAVVLDANNPETRAKEGIIPGAKLLSSSGGYDLAKEVPGPKNTEVVFYCANAKCMASHGAAQRAVDAGYTNVKVLADGIQGWKKAGHPTEKVRGG